MRMAISAQIEVTKGATSEVIRNRPKLVSRVARGPKRACAQDDSSRPEVIAASTPVTSHWASGRPMAKSAMIAGRATLMLVDDSTMVMVEMISRASSQRG
ncbi:hypothetical protein D9M71_629530 [compost metagenome]